MRDLPVTHPRRALPALLLAALLPACPERDPDRDGAVTDTAKDSSDAADEPFDAAPDAGPDAIAVDVDAGDDAPGDDGAAPDVGTDVAGDLLDAPADAPPDAPACTSVPWRTAQVSSGGNWGGSTAIAVDPRGVPHIVLHRAVYGSYGARELLYASPGASGAWELENITTGTGNDRDDTTDLAFDAAGAPHVVFPGLVDGGPHPSIHATRADGRWAFTALRGGNTWASLAIDGRDAVHVVSGQTEINYAQRGVAGAWTHEAQRGARCMSVAAAADGAVHVSYATAPASPMDSELYYAGRSPSGAWTFERVDGLGFRVEFSCETMVGLGPGGAVHVVYTAATGLRHALRSADGSWTTEAAPAAGRSPSMAVDDRGGVHLVFGEPLTHAYLPPGGAWRTDVIDARPGGVPGADTSVAVDRTGAVHIASYDETARTSPSYPVYYTTGRVCDP